MIAKPMLLRDLIAHTPLQLELATPGNRPDRVVRGAHAIDLAQPGPWIGSGYVVLTTGIALRGSVERQREFVHGVADADGAALGFGVDVVFKTIPRPMFDAAEERGLALFNVPYEVPFRDIIRFVTASTLRDEAAQLAWVIAIQDDLLALVERASAEQEIADRLGGLLDARVALFAPDGRVLAVTGHPPLKELWDVVRSGTRATPFAPREYAFVKEVEVAGAMHSYLAVLVRNGNRVETVARPVVGFTARVLQMVAANRLLAFEGERLAQTALLHDLLHADHLDGPLVDRLRALGFDSTSPVRVLVASARTTNEPEWRRVSAELRAGVDSVIDRQGAPRLVGVCGREVVALWQGNDVRDELASLVANCEWAVVGLADAVDDLHELKRAIAEARGCVAVARRGDERLVSSGQLSLSEALVAQLTRSQASRVDDALAPLRGERPEVLETLVTFFENDMDSMACARAMFLHPNSLRYRLAKIESKLGRSLRSPETITDLHLALRTRALRGDATQTRRRRPSSSA
jgi:purine catabolism regulator